ncbi:MAG: hypothetical protein N2255_01790 [Kiritimatiellae bacterium]|nr:hypothetical protein [Kiritimatiellia bacterium]
MYDVGLRDWEKAEFLEAARLCATWVVNNQNTEDRPWGQYRVQESADYGRFTEKTVTSQNDRKPAGVWLTALYLCGLTDLLKTPVLDKDRYRKAIELGARSLCSLQCFDSRWPKAIGGFHEFVPGMSYSAPRDAATGAFGLVALYLSTGKREYLDRALRFAEWYSTYGSDSEGYPWDDYDLETGKGTSRKRGDWQAGGALIYYQLWRITGQEKWKSALRRVLDVLVGICEKNEPGTDTAYDFHGDCIISVGNDDFANMALLGGYMAFREKRYLDLVAVRLRKELQRQAPNGAFPGYGGTFVTALEILEALDLAAAGVEVLPIVELVDPLIKAARCGLALQEKMAHNPLVMGGIYGQSNYGHARDVIHGRDTAYGLQLFLRLAGYRAATYTVLGWENMH